MTPTEMPAEIRPEARVNVQTYDIPLSMIDADPKRNVRTVMDEAKLREITESLKKVGQLTPAKVEKKHNGRFDMVFGFRRLEAAKLLEWPTLRCEIEEVALSGVDRRLANIAENLAREDLTTYDQAMAFRNLKNEDDLSGIKIGQHVGRSTQYVNNLIRVAEGLDDVVLRRWREECEPRFGKDKDGKKLDGVLQICTMDWLAKLVANVPKDGHEHEMLKAMGLVADEDDEESDAGSGRSPSQTGAPKRATKAELDRALEMAEAKFKEAKGDDNKAEIRGVVMALKFAIGKNKSIRGVYKPGIIGESEE